MQHYLSWESFPLVLSKYEMKWYNLYVIADLYYYVCAIELNLFTRIYVSFVWKRFPTTYIRRVDVLNQKDIGANL